MGDVTKAQKVAAVLRAMGISAHAGETKVGRDAVAPLRGNPGVIRILAYDDDTDWIEYFYYLGDLEWRDALPRVVARRIRARHASALEGRE